MKTYAVLMPKYTEQPERSAKLISDHWRVLGFLVPSFWLIYYRLWLHLAAWVALSMSILMVPTTWALSAYLLTALARYWIALEGPRWYIAKLERNGWHLHSVIEASNYQEAEWKFAHFVNADYGAVKAAQKPQQLIKNRSLQSFESFGMLDMTAPQKA